MACYRSQLNAITTRKSLPPHASVDQHTYSSANLSPDSLSNATRRFLYSLQQCTTQLWKSTVLDGSQLRPVRIKTSITRCAKKFGEMVCVRLALVKGRGPLVHATSIHSYLGLTSVSYLLHDLDGVKSNPSFHV
jgi:hypothetical protein